MSQVLDHHALLSPADYLAFERGAAVREMRHEYEEGHLVPMIGAGFNHNRLTRTLATCLSNAVALDIWDIFIADVKVVIDGGRAYYYPDVIVTPRVRPDPDHIVSDPLVVVEVLSASTQRRDRTTKVRTDQRLPSLRQILLVAQDACQVEHHRRLDTGWTIQALTAGDVIDLSTLGVAIPVHALYRWVDWSANGEFSP